MQFDDLVLRASQAGRLQQDSIRYPDLADVMQGMRLHEAAERSLTTGQPVILNGG